jgi:hypothetical protein
MRLQQKLGIDGIDGGPANNPKLRLVSDTTAAPFYLFI